MHPDNLSASRYIRIWHALRAAAFLGAIGALFGIGGAHAQDAGSKSAALIQSANAAAQPFLTDPRWSAVRNAFGGARAVVIVPHDLQGGFILTASGGDGVLLRRHGNLWSDPVFVHVGSAGVGFQAGAESQCLLMLIMSDATVDQILQGTMSVGGSAGFALANLGLGGGGSGNITNGLEILSVATASGLFAGSGISGLQLSPQDAFNQANYGPGYNMQVIAAGTGGNVMAAAGLRGALIQAVTQAWYQ